MTDREPDQKKEKSEVKTFTVPFPLKEFNESFSISNNENTQLSQANILNQAFKFHSEGNISKAVRYYQYFINQGFKDHRVFSNYGTILKDLGKLQEAELLQRKAIKISPDYFDAHYNLGNILNNLGKLQEAELSTRKAIEIKPDFATAHLNLGNILNDLNKLKEAELSTRKAIEINPDFAMAHSNLGSILNALGEKKGAEISTRKAIELKPDYAIAHSNLGSILQDLDQLKEAELSTRKAIELKPDYAISHSNLGSILQELGQLKEAELSTRKAIELKPTFADAHSNLGKIFSGQGNLKEAELSTRKAISLNPDLFQAHVQLGEILFELGKPEEASIIQWNAIKIRTSTEHLKSYIKNAKVIKKTAFLVFSCSMFNQLQPVIEINPDAFEILVPNDVSRRVIQKINNIFKIKDIKIRSVNELIENNLMYEKLVSTRGDSDLEYINNKNNLQTKTLVPIIKLLGKKNIRFMYTAGKNKYTILSYWNKYYDGILCYGPYHEEKFKHKHKIATSQMGYPRFDKYFKPGFKRNYLIEKFKCDPKKKTIVWLPTWTSLSSIDKYYKVISSLRIEHNIVVRPHPSIKKTDPESYKKLFSVDFNYIDDNDNDNVQLYALADLMLFDYGGPMFGALYLNKNLAFLEMNLEAKNHSYLDQSPSEDYLKSFFPDRIAKLENLKSICNYCLNNPPNSSVMGSLREEFFNINYQGNSAERAYELLNTNNWLK